MQRIEKKKNKIKDSNKHNPNFRNDCENWDYTLFEYQKNISDAKQTAPNPYKNQKSIIYTPLMLRNRFNQPFYNSDTEYNNQ